MLPSFVVEMLSVAALMGPDGRGCGCSLGGEACLLPAPFGWAPPAQPASQALPSSAPSPHTISRRLTSRHATVLMRSLRCGREPQVLAVGDVHDVVVPAEHLW